MRVRTCALHRSRGFNPLRTLRGALPGAFAAATLLAALGCGDGPETTAPDPEPLLAAAATAALPIFTAINAGGEHSCALAGDGRAYCWGENAEGQLGDGTSSDRVTPVAVAGGLRFVQISAGAEHTCAIATNERAYCWGDGVSSTPKPVAGNRRFRNVNAGNNHTCAVNPFDVGFCWGNNFFGQLGTGGGNSSTPVRIAGGHRWRRVDAGGETTCGVTTDNRAFCWGDLIGKTPVAVPGGLRFSQVTVGGGAFGDAQGEEPFPAHICGVTTDDRGYCWGRGFEGGLGNGGRGAISTPSAISGTRRWRQVIAGLYHSCGVTAARVAFCWGYNEWGYNGDGTTNTSLVPVRVAGGIAFGNVTTGVDGRHSCGLTTDGRVYCWGDNSSGQLGDGTRTRRLAPVPVTGAG